jgi:hypothetical protein
MAALSIIDKLINLLVVEESHDEESAKTINDIYKTVFGKLIIDNVK